MPRSHLSGSPSPQPVAPAPDAGEPALTELRRLERRALDTVVGNWLNALGLDIVEACDRRPRPATYQARLDAGPISLPIRVRIYQRKNSLQVHHVEAFLGYLLRMGVPAGVLITTGACAPEAHSVAAHTEAPRVQVLSGEEWLTDLARARAGVRRCRLWRFILDLRTLFVTPGSRVRKKTPHAGETGCAR